MLIAASVLILQVGQKPIDAFVPLVKEFGKSRPTATPNPVVSKAIDLMISHVYDGAKSIAKVDEAWCKRRVSGFDQLLDKFGGELPTDFSWVSTSVASQGKWRAVSVNLGPICRTTVFGTTGKPVVGLESLRWVFGFQLKPQFEPSGSIYLTGESVQDAGMIYQIRLDYLTLKSGVYQVSKPVIRKAILDDAGSIKKIGTKFEIESIDEPKSFSLPSAIPALLKKETFVVKDAQLVNVGTVDESRALRFFDNWLLETIRSTAPDAVQKAALKVLPDERVVHNLAISESNSATTLILEFEDVTLRAVLRPAGNGWIVEQVTRE